MNVDTVYDMLRSLVREFRLSYLSRALLVLLISFSASFPAHSGALKWLGRGAAVCAMNTSCSGAVSKGVAQGSLKLGTYLAKRYAKNLASKCLASPQCVGYATAATGLGAGTSVGLSAQAALDSWMAANDDDRAPNAGSNLDASNRGSSTGNLNPEEPPEDEDGEPIIGKKLDYLFGKASGREHNLLRTAGMDKQLQRVGISDTPANREMIRRKVIETYNDPSSISKIDGKWTTREMFVMGPRGGVKIDTVWIKNELISFVVKGGK